MNGRQQGQCGVPYSSIWVIYKRVAMIIRFRVAEHLGADVEEKRLSTSGDHDSVFMNSNSAYKEQQLQHDAQAYGPIFLVRWGGELSLPRKYFDIA